jgi:phospholipid/cholesterol/gamma-HCH transport system permease protein
MVPASASRPLSPRRSAAVARRPVDMPIVALSAARLCALAHKLGAAFVLRSGSTMSILSIEPAAITQATAQVLALSGSWTARALGGIDARVDTLSAPSATIVDAARIEALDTVGAWLLQRLMQRLRSAGSAAQLQHLRPQFARLLAAVGDPSAAPAPAGEPGTLASVGRGAAALAEQALALLSFIGESAAALGACLAHPRRMRWRPVLFNIRSAGFDALPIVGLLSFLLGIVVAYQGADQLRRYGANIFVADLVGLSMLREFAPLLTAIIVAGRSGSAYAAQIGTMSVSEEIDAMRTLAIAPRDLLVLPKVIALMIALPLLTVFADALGVFGGMIMAQTQLGVPFAEFLERFVKAVDLSSYLIGIGKAPVFAAVIAVVGCFQGFRTHGGADSVGRQTTRSVVQATFLVIVADALFSIVFSVLDL